MKHDRLIAAVAELIRDTAERHILPRYHRLDAGEILTKSKGELVTVVDREVEAILVESLGRLAPGIPTIGEEGVEAGHCTLDDLTAESCWLIDPLDGTANYASGVGPFGVMVALLRRGETRIGWLYDPVSRAMSVAVAGQGSVVNGRPVRVAGSGRTRPVAAIAAQFMSERQRESVRLSAGRTMDLVPIPRCAAAHYPLIVGGGHDLAVFQRILPWDHAAGALFLTEAGGVVTHWDGQPYAPGPRGTGIIAANSTAAWETGVATLGLELAAIGEMGPA